MKKYTKPHQRRATVEAHDFKRRREDEPPEWWDEREDSLPAGVDLETAQTGSDSKESTW